MGNNINEYSMTQFFHCKDPSQPSVDYILCTECPFIIGKVISFKDSKSLEEFKESKQPVFVGAEVSGYNILVVAHAALWEDIHIWIINRMEIVNSILKLMAESYLIRINRSLHRFKKYKK